MLGLVTIGQSPRSDVVASMFADMECDAFLEDGALNELDQEQIDQLRPGDGELPLVTRLRDGSEVVVAKPRLIPHLRNAISRLETAGCAAICVLCTGAFPRFESRALLIYPDQIVRNVVDAILPVGTVGVLIPHGGQAASMLDKWTTTTRSALTAVASPYSGADHVRTQVASLESAGADAIVLDCMGFDRKMLADARSVTSIPVLLSNGVVGSVVREMFETSDLSS